MRPILQAFGHKSSLKILLTVYHLVFPFVVWHYKEFFINLNKTDADQIFKLASQSGNWFELFGLGTQCIVFLSYPFVKMGVGQLTLSMLFALISLKGFLIYANLLYDNYREKKNTIFLLVLLFLLIPSLHFWTSLIGKDAIVFYLMAVILSNIIRNKYTAPSLFLAVSLVLIIRPYVFFIILPGYALHLFLNADISPKQKKRSLLIALILGIVALPVLQNFLKLEHISLSGIRENFARIVTYSRQNGGSSIDLENSTYPERLFLVLFRPMFYDARSILQFMASAENVCVWALVLILIKNTYKINIHKLKTVVFPLSISILLILFYSLYMYNLGLASRMRTMFLPYIFFTLFWFIKTKKEEK